MVLWLLLSLRGLLGKLDFLELLMSGKLADWRWRVTVCQSLSCLIILFFGPLGLDFPLEVHELTLEARVRENNWPLLSGVR